MKTTALITLAVSIVGVTTAQDAPTPGYAPVVYSQSMAGSGICPSVNDFRITFPTVDTMRVEYWGFYLNSALRGTTSAGQIGYCIPLLKIGGLQRGWRLSIGDSTWKGHAKFTGGNKLASWDTALQWQMRYNYNWHQGNRKEFKYYDNAASLGIHKPGFLPGDQGDYDTDFTTTVKSPDEVLWSPCFQGTAGDDDAMYWDTRFVLESVIKTPGDAIFGYPASSGQPGLVQEFKLRWEKCDPESIWSRGRRPMQKPADAYSG